MAIINDIEVGEDVVPVPYIANRFAGLNLLIIGCGTTLWDDLEQIKKHGWKGDCMAVNRTMIDMTFPIQHGVSGHPYDLALFGLYRRFNFSHQNHVNTHSCGWETGMYETYLLPQFIWDFPGYYHGSSAMLGTLAGLVMGYENVVLAGVPMNGGGYYYNPKFVWDYAGDHLANWEKAAKNCFKGRVTSLSGNTRELLGAPKGH